MNKLSLILSIFAMLAAGYLAYDNRSRFVSLREEKHKLNDDITARVKDINVTNNNIEVALTKLGDLRKNIGVQETLLSQAQDEVKRRKTDLVAKQNLLDVSEKKKAEYMVELQKLPPGVKVETLEADINKMTQQVADNKVAVKKIDEDIDAAKEELTKDKKVLSDLEQAQQVRRVKFTRNSMEATVTSVNYDFGFVVVSAGRNKGLAQDVVLIVTRGGNSVAKVKATTVEPSLTICNIIKGSQAPGIHIERGDKVILETLNK